MEFNLKQALKEYKPTDAKEKEDLIKIIEFLDNNSNCFERKNLEGHITAGALVIDNTGNVLLNHHKVLDIWLHFGGHSDGDNNSLNVARREVMEESGICDFDDSEGKIFDIDVHMIPENKEKKEPAHYHYDIRFLFIAKKSDFKISDESSDIKWVTMEKARELISNQATIRMINKAEVLWKETNKID